MDGDEIVSRLRIRSLASLSQEIQPHMVKGSAYNSGLVANLTYHCTAQNSEGYAEQATVIAVKGMILSFKY